MLGKVLRHIFSMALLVALIVAGTAGTAQAWPWRYGACYGENWAPHNDGFGSASYGGKHACEGSDVVSHRTGADLREEKVIWGPLPNKWIPVTNRVWSRWGAPGAMLSVTGGKSCSGMKKNWQYLTNVASEVDEGSSNRTMYGESIQTRPC